MAHVIAHMTSEGQKPLRDHSHCSNASRSPAGGGFDVFFMVALAVALFAGVTLLITQLRYAEQQALPIVAQVVESLVIPRPVLVNKVIKYRIPNHGLVDLILVLPINVAIIRPQ